MEDDSQRRIHQYTDIDGMRELMMGMSLFIVGLTYVVIHLPIDEEVIAAIVTALPIIIMLLFLGSLWFKQRVTYPRTGYVMPRRPSSFAVAFLILSFGSMIFKRWLPDDIYLTQEGYPLLFGAFLAVMMLLAGQGLRRFCVYAAVALVAGVGSVAAGLGADVGMTLTASLTGLVLVVLGGRVLRRYLARTSPGDV